MTMQIDKLFIIRKVLHQVETQQIISASGVQPVVIEAPEVAYQWVRSQRDPVASGKKTLLVTQNKGSFLKQCPGTSHYTCCDYQILHLASYCCMDCAYCILQIYFHPPVLQFFVNHDAMFMELEQSGERLPSKRIGTGEFTDSLIWENYTDLTPRLVEYFGRQNNLVLELKTKTTAINRLADLAHNRKTIVAWSLNTPRMITSLERGTASLEARLRAARACQEWGYPLAFHFDPMVIYPGWENGYQKVVDMLFRHIDPADLVWISMGTFRFIPALKSIIQNRFPDSTFVYGEFIPGLDGKMRYLRPLREEVYARMAGWIRSYAPDVALYLCMEDDCIWENALGVSPSELGGLPAYLDRAAQKVCRLC